MDKHVSLSDGQHAFATEQAAENGLESGDDYVRSLIDREQAVKQLRDKLFEGRDSPPAGPADETWFDELGKHAAKHAKA